MIDRKYIFVADLVALPFFLLSLYYLFHQTNSTLRNTLIIAVIIALVVDTVFTLDYVK